MNILRTDVRALIAPSPSTEQADEQRRRAERLAQRGVVDCLIPEQLTPDGLEQAIMKRLVQPKAPHGINLDGAAHTSRCLQTLLDHHLPLAV